MKKLIFLLLMIGIFFVSFASAISWNEGLISYWNFDDGSGTNLEDIATGNHNGTIVNGSTWQGGILGNSLNFSSVSEQFVNITNVTDIGIADPNNFSISFWIYPNSTSQTTHIFSKAGSFVIRQEGLILSIYFADSVDQAFHNDYQTNDDALNIGRWQQVVITYDGTGTFSAADINIYVNGTEIPGTKTWTHGDTIDVGAVCYMSKHTTYYFDGGLDEMGFWDRVLSSDEILDMYNNGIGLTYGDQKKFTLNEVTAPSNVYELETINQTFFLNVTSESNYSIVNSTLDYGGTEYSPTKISAGNNSWWTQYITHTFEDTNDILYNWTIAINNTITGDIYYQTLSYTQIVNPTIFSICNATYTIPYLNISFKDESTDEYINTTIPYSSFIYYVNNSDVNKTYVYTNSTLNYNYTFCVSTERAINVIPSIQYKQGTSYPQRLWNPSIQEYTSTITNQILYLLSSTDGIYVTFQVINLASQPISNVMVNGTREIDGSDVIVASGLTDSAGSITFWLNPDILHTFEFLKLGYDYFTTSIFPTQTTYTITLGEETEITDDLTQGISYTIDPIGDYLNNNTIYVFNYNLTSEIFNIDRFGFGLRYDNGTIIGNTSATTQGGSVSIIANVSNSSRIFMDYYYLIDGEFSNGTRTWTISYGGNEFSLYRFFIDLSSYIDAGMFGIDNFGKAIISFFAIVIIVVVLSTRYGIASESAIMGIIFGIILFLDVGLGLIPNVDFGGINRVDNFLTIVTGIILIGILIREETK